MARFEKEIDGIYRLAFPFDTVFTSIFLITTEIERVLVDTGASGDDVDTYLLPALSELGLSLNGISALVLTHRHGDHAGGMQRIMELCPHMRVITRAGEQLGPLLTYPLPGHTEDMIGVLDGRTHTLVTGDGLQGDGVDKYRCSLRDREAYLETLSRIEKDGRIENLIFSHAYEPWYKASVFGRRAVTDVLSDCRKAAEERT
jgi:glyoxylase-like metal-dependent hydrolase (beta-lactamase superfamily II)